MTAVAPRRRTARNHRLVGMVGITLLLAAPATGQEVGSPEADPSAIAAGEAVSASELQAAIDSIKRRVAEQQDGRQTTGTSELAAELRSARQAIAELTQNLARLRGERDALQTELMAQGQLEAELREALDTSLERVSALEDALGMAERAAAEARAALADATDRAVADNAAYEAALAESQVQAEAAAERVAGLEASLATAEAEMASLRDAMETAAEAAAAQLAERETALDERITQAETAVARVAELEAAVLARERAIEAVRGELAQAAAASEAALEEREMALSASRAEAERAVARLAELETALADIQVAADERSAELAAAQAALETQDSELAAAAGLRAELEDQLAAVVASQAAFEQQVGEAEAGRHMAEAAIAEREQEMAELRQVASRSVAEVQELGETLLGTLAENEALVAALAEARDSRTLIEAELRAMRRDLEASAVAAVNGGTDGDADATDVPLALVASDAVVEAIDAELAAARQQIATLNEELIARDKQLATAGAAGDADALSQQLGLLQRQVDTLDAENAKLLDELAELQSTAAPELITASLAPDEAVEHYLGQLNAVDTGDGWWLTVPEGLVFAPGSDELAAGTEPVVGQIAALLGYFGDAKVRIVGHTDSFGDAEVNRELSLQRAKAVGRVLVDSFGVTAGRIATEGFGEEQPISSNATIEGRRANRRVEVYIQR